MSKTSKLIDPHVSGLIGAVKVLGFTYHKNIVTAILIKARTAAVQDGNWFLPDQVSLQKLRVDTPQSKGRL